MFGLNKGATKVIAHPETGVVVTQNVNNPEYGTIRVDSETITFSQDGFMNKSRRTAFIRGEYKLLLSLGLKDGMSLPGKIIKKESYQPFFEGQNPKINPSTGEVVLTNGRETYLQFVYTEDVNASDVFITEKAEVVSDATQSVDELTDDL